MLISSKNRSGDFKEVICKTRWEGADRRERSALRVVGRPGHPEGGGTRIKAENALVQLSK